MTSLIDKALSCVGLMRVAEHEQIVADNDEKAYAAWAKMANERDDLKLYRDDWQVKHNSLLGKFKKAVADLEKQAEEIADWRTALKRMEGDRDNWRAQALRDEPDALAMRRKRQRDRELKAAKAAGKVQP